MALESSLGLEEIVRRAPVLTLRLALAHVQTIEGALRIHKAEREGFNRPEVLQAAERRIEELSGLEPAAPRIVEAVGIGRRHPGW